MVVSYIKGKMFLLNEKNVMTYAVYLLRKFVLIKEKNKNYLSSKLLFSFFHHTFKLF